MSSEEFKLFEKISTLNIHGGIFKGEYLDKYGFDWMELQKLKEYGLISLDNSLRNIVVEANDVKFQILNNEYGILFKNTNDTSVKYKIPSYLFTNVAEELIKIIDMPTDITIAINIAKEAEKISKKEKGIVSLHKINYFYENGDKLNYDETDLLTKEMDAIEENALTFN